MSYDGVFWSFTTTDGREVVSINPKAMKIAKQAVGNALKKPDTLVRKSDDPERECQN